MQDNSPETPRATVGGIVHSYQQYDPLNFPSPTAEPPDMASAAMEHMLQYGDTRDLTEEELARAVKIDPSQIKGLGPSLDMIAESLKQRKEKILRTYETEEAQKEAADNFKEQSKKTTAPEKLSKRFREAVRDEQLRELERLYYASGDDRSPFSRQLVQLIDRLGEKYQVEQMASKYAFTGNEPMDVPKALEIKQELEEIDKLLAQIDEIERQAIEMCQQRVARMGVKVGMKTRPSLVMDREIGASRVELPIITAPTPANIGGK